MDFEYEKQHCMAFFCHIFQRLSMVLGEKGGWLLYLSCVRCWTAHIPRERREIPQAKETVVVVVGVVVLHHLLLVPAPVVAVVLLLV